MPTWCRGSGRGTYGASGVDVGVDDAVERVGAAGRQRAADHRGDDEPRRRHALLGQEHDRNGREQQQLDDARLGQRDVGALTTSAESGECGVRHAPIVRSHVNGASRSSLKRRE